MEDARPKTPRRRPRVSNHKGSKKYERRTDDAVMMHREQRQPRNYKSEKSRVARDESRSGKKHARTVCDRKSYERKSSVQIGIISPLGELYGRSERKQEYAAYDAKVGRIEYMHAPDTHQILRRDGQEGGEYQGSWGMRLLSLRMLLSTLSSWASDMDMFYT